MIWYNVNLLSNRLWDIEMKRLALRTPKMKTKRTTKGKRKLKVSWIKKRKKS
jgi:hypothetical protein